MRGEPDNALQTPHGMGAGRPNPPGLRIGVVIATLGRPAECNDLLERLAAQSLKPAALVISAEKEADIPAAVAPGIDVVIGQKGLCAQRNRGVRSIVDRCDVVVFFDDDYLPSRTALAGISNLFHQHPDVVGATGKVLADGVLTGGIKLSDALAIVDKFDAAAPPVRPVLRNVHTAYGCNMAFRISATRTIAFDEKLPLYGWQEDVDFAGQASQFGRVVATNAFAGVHRGVSHGRTPGLRLGFSQIVNPLYLVRKGTMRPSHAALLMVGNVIANHLKMFRPEPHIDRAGRAKGNWLGLAHVLSGQLNPLKMLELA